MFPALLAAVSLAVQLDTGALTLALDGTPIITGVLAQESSKIIRASARAESSTRQTVDVAYADGSSAVCSYILEGNDCTVEYGLTNTSGRPQTIDLAGLTCAFPPNAVLKGTLPYWHASFYGNLAVWHPGLFSPLGAVYAGDGSTAAVFYSPSEFGRQSLINATFALGLRIPNPCRIEFHTRRTIEPEASDHVSLVLRVTHDLSEEGLHGGYKKFLAGKYPAPLYVPDPRPAAQFSSVDQSLVTPSNPHGYNGDLRRIDRPERMAEFLRWLADPLRDAHAQGCIFWAPGGAETVMYPPNFDANLTRIADTWPTLVEGFHTRGLRVGVCARAAENADDAQPGHPAVSPIDPADTRQVETLRERFRHAARLGVDAYYLDSFGGNWASTRLLPAIRETVGATVPIYTEYCSDATLPYADRYCEYKGGDGVSWNSPEQLSALRYLFPQSVWLCVSRTGQPWPTDFARLRLTPLIPDYLVKTVLARPPSAVAAPTLRAP